MRKLLLSLTLFALGLSLMATDGAIRLNSGFNQAVLHHRDESGIDVYFNVGKLDFSDVQTENGSFTKLNVEGFATTSTVGEPMLPLQRKLISVPLGATVDINITGAVSQTIVLSDKGINHPLYPKQESVSKSANFSELPFAINNEFYGGTRSTAYEVLSATELGMMRGERIFALDYTPMNYNPASGTLEVVHSVEAEIRFFGADYGSTMELKQRTASAAFEPVFAGSIWNYTPLRATQLRHPTGYIIIAPQSFNAALQPFIDWKTREGFNVTLSSIESIGNNLNSIKNYMQGIWNSATADNPAPSYLLIVGDTPQVVTGGSTISGETHPTDLHYVRLEGNDYFPELFFGRFSATTPAEVTNQVNKTLQYAQFLMPDTSYLQDTILIAGMDSYWASSHGNGQINYAVNNYFNAAHNINSTNFFYPNSGSNAANIRNLVSQGAGYVNYTAHGNTQEWSDPYFGNSHVFALQNIDKPSFVLGNCCLTNKFDVGICFGEAWLRAEGGAVVYIGGTNSTYWDEDYWWSVGYKGSPSANPPAYDPTKLGMYDALFHENGEAFEDWAHTAGGIVMMGNMAVVQSNSSRKNLYWEIYSIMGDPSVNPYVGMPEELYVEYPEIVFIGTNSVDIQTEPYAYVALSQNNVLYGAGLADASGQLTLNFEPFTEPGTATIVATRSRRRPMISEISVVPNEGAYVAVGQLGFPEGTETVKAGDSLPIELTLTNVGVLPAENLSLSVTSLSSQAYATNIVAELPDLQPNQSLNIADAFTINIEPGIEDQSTVQLIITISDGESDWSSTRSFIVDAPNIIINSISYFDPNNNGNFEPGETINITLHTQNIGHMAVQSGRLNLILNSDLATLPMSTFVLPGMNEGSTMPLVFDLVISEDAQDGDTITVGIALDMGLQMINHSLTIPVGPAMEGFETGNFSAFPWENDNARPWTIDSNTAASGLYSAKSGITPNNGKSELKMTANVPTNGNISFSRRVSSEADYDKLNFYIDNELKGDWSGEQDWAEVSFPITAGVHTFKWEYKKDVSYTSGADAAWIDDIKLPFGDGINLPMAYLATTAINFPEAFPSVRYEKTFALRNLGKAALTGVIQLSEEFSLYRQGVELSNDEAYSIEPGHTAIYSVVYYSESSIPVINGSLQITTNDSNLPLINIPVNVRPSSNEDEMAPFVTELKGNYPNPFNPSTNIAFSLKEASKVSISIYNLKGQLVKSLLNTELSAGQHQISWDGRDDGGNLVSSGMYFYRMTTPAFKASKKMMLMK